MKVLLISHNPFSTYNNMGATFLSLFSGFQKEELCQLYVYPSLPDVDVCHSYYRVTDKQVLSGFWRLKKVGGELPAHRFPSEGRAFEKPEDAALYLRRGNHGARMRLLRDGMWKLARWDHKGLWRWLDRERPTHIFLAPGYAGFLYDIALKIARRRKIPVVTYLCDDYYFVKSPKGLAGKLQLALLRNKTGQLMKSTSRLVTISPELAQTYGRTFSLPAEVIMTGANIQGQSVAAGSARRLCYFGNLTCGRQTALARIGQALEAIRASRNEDYCLEIYTAERDPEILEPLKKCPLIKLRPFVTGEAFRQAFFRAELLVYAESFREADMDRTKYSISTKIADSLASGVPLFAYGPAAQSSMQHLLRTECAFVVTEPEALQPVLLAALQDTQRRQRLAERAMQVASEFHHAQKNSERLRSWLEGTSI